MVAKFKTGEMIMLSTNNVFEIIDANYNLPFILIRLLNNSYIGPINQNLFEQHIIHRLGTNTSVVHLLLGNTARGNK